MRFTRPTRGAVRLDDMQFDVGAIAADVERFEEGDWTTLNYGSAWGQIQVIKPDGKGGKIEHPKLEASPGLKGVIERFPAKCLDMSLARLGPGGGVGNHRDISGGTPMGVARFHVPVITNPEVKFYVSDKPVYMGPGETWNLDTSYVHRVQNEGDIWRVHVIIDFEMNDALKEMLPKEDWVDRLHRVHFAVICFVKGIELLFKNPRMLIERVVRFIRLMVFGQSQLVFDD